MGTGRSTFIAPLQIPKLSKILHYCRKEAQRLASSFEGKIATTKPSDLAEMISSYEALSDVIGKLLSHADLNFATDMTSAEAGQHSQTLREDLSAVFSSLLFIELELAAMDEATYQDALAENHSRITNLGLGSFALGAPYQLEQRLEQMLVERGPVGKGSWVRLFDETMAGLTFDFEGNKVSEAEILNMLSSPNASAKT